MAWQGQVLRVDLTGKRCAADDTLPRRILDEPLTSGSAKGAVCPLDAMLPAYYEQCGWSADGVPSNATLACLGL